MYRPYSDHQRCFCENGGVQSHPNPYPRYAMSRALGHHQIKCWAGQTQSLPTASKTHGVCHVVTVGTIDFTLTCQHVVGNVPNISRAVARCSIFIASYMDSLRTGPSAYLSSNMLSFWHSPSRLVTWGLRLQ